MKPHEKSDAAALYTIRERCSTILERIRGKLMPDFMADPALQDSVALQLMLIGEEVKKLSPGAKGRFPNLEWNNMARLRDKITHHYNKIDLLQVWEIATENILSLLEALASEKI